MDICPAYWDWLDQQFDQGELASIDMVGRELKAGDDALAKWQKNAQLILLPMMINRLNKFSLSSFKPL